MSSAAILIVLIQRRLQGGKTRKEFRGLSLGALVAVKVAMHNCAKASKKFQPRPYAHSQHEDEKHATGILVHGYHLQADGWESLAWGCPPY